MDDAARPALTAVREAPAPGYGARRAHPLDRHRARPASSRSRTSRSRPRRSNDVDVQADRAAVVGAVRDRLGDLPADRAAALAHDRRPPRARLRRRPPAAHAAADPGRRSRSPSWSIALALRGPIQDDLFDGSTALYWVLVVARARLRGELLRARLAGRAPVVRPLRRARVHGGALAAACSRSRWRSASPHGQTAVAMGMAAAPFVSLSSCRWRSRAGRPRRGEQRADAGGARASPAAGASRSPCWRSWLAEQTLLNAGVLTSTATAADAAVAGFVFNVLLIARAPLQLFQAIQGSLLPHLAGLEATEGQRGVRARDPGHGAGDRGLRGRGRARAAAASARSRWASCSTTPFDLRPLRASRWWRSGWASTSPPARSTRRRWRATAPAPRRPLAGQPPPLFVGWMLSPLVDDELLRAEVGYLGAAALLSALLAVVYRATSASSGPRTSGPS